MEIGVEGRDVVFEAADDLGLAGGSPASAYSRVWDT